MQKRLVKVGHSLALVIDKPFLAVLNINQTSRLSIGCDGKRLVVEPLYGDSDPRTPSAREALATFRELERLGMTQELFDQVAPVPMRLGAYLIALDSGRELQQPISTTMRRMAELRKRLRYGWIKRDAIAAAVANVPFLLPTGVETRLDDGEKAPMRGVLDVLLGDARHETGAAEEIDEAAEIDDDDEAAEAAEAAARRERAQIVYSEEPEEEPSTVPVCIPMSELED